MKLAISISLSLLLLLSCAHDKKNIYEYQLNSLNYMQVSAEAKALYYQGYNIAKVRLDEHLKKFKKGVDKPLAVVLDLDETVLDNTPYQAWALKNNVRFPGKIINWMMLSKCELLPGASDFIHYAHKKGVEIVYITNRDSKLFQSTFDNLKNVGLPVKSDLLLLKNSERSKESRRAKIAKDYNILLFLGDTLSDFSNLFEKDSESERNISVHQNAKLFGSKFILFPNPLYGEWDPGASKYREGDSVMMQERYKALKTVNEDLK